MKKLLIYAAIGLIAVSTMASELMSFYKSKFSGINNRVNVRLLQDDESPGMSNFNLDEVGSIKERDLFGQYNSLSGALGSNSINGLFKFYTTNSKFLIACAGTNIGLGSGGVFTSLTPTNNTVTAGSYFSGVTFNNRFYLFNPTSEPLVYTGSGSFHKLENSSAIPGTNCSFSAIHKARTWAARSDSFPYRLYYSSLDNAENWTATGGSLDLPDLTQSITGLISWGGYLYVFTETNIYILLGSTPNDFSLRKTNSMVGAIAPRSIKITDIGVCFLARSGVYAFDGNNSNKISDKINTTITGMSKTLIQNAAAIYDGQRYWLSYTPQGSSYNNHIIVYDILLKDWYMYQGDACNISYFERAYGGTDKGELYGGSAISNGIVYQLQNSTSEESISHSSQNDFNDGVTTNTVTTPTPNVQILNGDDTYTKLLLHFEGANGSTTFTDSSLSNHAFVVSAPAQISTAQPKLGLSSGLFDGISARITSVDSDDWYFPRDFTIDFWVRFTSLADSGLCSQVVDLNNRWFMQYISATNLLYFDIINGGVVDMEFTVPFTPVVGTWHHVAVARSNNTWYLFIDGVARTKTLTAGAYTANFVNLAERLQIGNLNGTLYLPAYMDEFRVSNGVARWTSNFTVPDAPYNKLSFSGTLTSQTSQINAAGTTTLGQISWIETSPANTKITFQTRTGATNDSVYFNAWQYWSSDNSVTLSTVTDATAIFTSSADDGSFTVKKPYPALRRNVLFYEDEDAVSTNSVSINTIGAVSKGKYIEAFIPTTNLAEYDWLGGWYKSSQTGSTVEFYIGEGRSSGNYVTFNTVTNSTVDGWNKWYWYIGGMTSTDKDAINYIKYRYTGDAVGFVAFSDVSAYNFYTSSDIISSAPNDWIQYRAILGTNDFKVTPKLSSVVLTYTPSLTTTESSLSSYYYTKWFDFQSPQINKQFDSIVLEVNSTTANTVTGSSALCTINCDYDIDFGTKTGTISFIPTNTANTVRLLKNFPSSTYGKSMRLKIYNDNKDAQVTIKGAEIRYRPEKVTPD